MNLVKFKIRLKHLNETLVRLQLPELCIDTGDGTIKAELANLRHGRRARRGTTKKTRIRLALVEMRGALETAAQFVKDLEDLEAQAAAERREGPTGEPEEELKLTFEESKELIRLLAKFFDGEEG